MAPARPPAATASRRLLGSRGAGDVGGGAGGQRGAREVALGPVAVGDDAEHRRRPVHLADRLGIRWVIVTHTHPDHSPLAKRLAGRTGARLLGLPPPDDGRQDATFVPQHAPGDGEELVLGECRLIAIHTPGHASNCVCYLLKDERLLFTGDHVLEGVTPVILPPDGDMAAYLHSIGKLEARDFERIAPGHGDVIERGKPVLKALRVHRLAREAKVLRSLQRLTAATLDELTPVVYDDVPADRHRWARLTLEAHLIKLARDSRVSLSEGLWRAHTP